MNVAAKDLISFVMSCFQRKTALLLFLFSDLHYLLLLRTKKTKFDFPQCDYDMLADGGVLLEVAYLVILIFYDSCFVFE